MSLELLFLGGYGQFVWPAFIFTFVSYFLLYLKTKKELKRLEKMYLIEFKQKPIARVEVVRRREFLKEILLNNTTY